MWTLSKPIRVILLLLAISLFGQLAQAKYGGGSGTADDPYQIATAADLIALGETPEDYDKHFILTDDVDLDPNLLGRKVFDKAIIAPDVDRMANGYQGATFSGTLRGQSHRIVNMTISGAGFLGLFGYLAEGAVVLDLGLVDVNVVGTDYCVAGLVGFTWGADVGGIVSDCYITGTISGGASVGALAGSNRNGRISTSYSTGTVSGTERVGGLVGENYGTVTQCHSTGGVGGGSSVGGLVGWNYEGNVTQCYSTGAVDGDSEVGGLVGWNYQGAVTHCYSTGTVSGTERVGGLVGRNGLSWDTPGTLTHCYSTGAVSGNSDVGGLVGYDWGDVTGCFWDVQTSGQPTSAGGTGKTTAQMQMPSTFVGWGACGAFWTINEGENYPHLAWENGAGNVIPAPTYGGGVGAAHDPYLIYAAEDLNTIGGSPCDWDKHFKLMGDIDLSGFDGEEGRPPFNIIAPATTIVCVYGYCWAWAAPFRGVFDGNRHTISHLTIKGGTCLGLFGLLGSGGEVKDLGVVDVNITGSGYYVGALAGWNQGGLVTQCYSSGVVSGTNRVGGLLGSNAGDVTQCYSTAAVSGKSEVGGLVGINYSDYSQGGTVTHCYSTGAVSGPGVGGLVGNDRVCIKDSCWDSGIVTGSFWDTQTSGQATSAGGTGKTTAEMQTASTFLDAGWDFVGESQNGTENIWAICEGVDYPHLAWEFVIGDFDADADTDFADFCILAEHWLAADGSFWCGQGCDLTNDGSVNWQDLTVLAESWVTGLAL
jgi:hypothetical protein